VTTLAHRVPLGGPRSGGVAARRAVIRWSRRMFRREWRRQLLVVTLLTVAVTAAIGSVTVVYNTAPSDDAAVGSAAHALNLDGADPRKLEAALAAARQRFGTIEVIEHRSVVVPGGVEKLDFRAQDPGGAYGGELLELRSGSFPRGTDEVAVTDGVAELLRLELGSTLALDGVRRKVAGVVENPRRLSDEFALVSPTSAGAPDHVAVLVNGSEAAVDSFVRSLPERSAFTGSQTRGNDRAADALAMFSVATVFLLLASLVAAASFAVVAQRRLRQLGMLTAIGATPKHLRLVLVTNGALVGTIAAAGREPSALARPVIE
jgi:putative ABC transport system permease protein